MSVFDETEKITSLNNYISVYKSRWEKIYDKDNVFRYKLLEPEEKMINDKYLLTCNPDRRYNRRAPQDITKFHQPFNDNKFNFTKVSSEEIMFTYKEEDSDDRHAVIVNVSPISKYHGLLCPSVEKRLPQIVTKESLKLAIDFMLNSSDRDLRIAYNSLCALASVNHLHFHMCFVKQTLPVETVECIQIHGPLYYLSIDYPAYAFAFEVMPPNNPYEDIYKALDYFISRSMPHNIMITRGLAFESDKEAIRLIIWPRKGIEFAKTFHKINVAALEFSGWITVYNKEVYDKIDQNEIERNLRIWKYEWFDRLCEDLKYVYSQGS